MEIGTAEARDAVRAVARRGDYDRYLSALLAPAECRDDLIALAAFAGSVLNLPHQVREPQIGEIRVQWWREAIAASAPTGDPVADTFADVVRRRGLPVQSIERLLDEVVQIIYCVEIETDAALDQALDASQGVLFGLAQVVVGGVDVAERGEIGCRYGGRAFGLARWARLAATGRAAALRPIGAGTIGNASGDRRQTIEAFKTRADACLSAFRSAPGAGRGRQSLALLPVALVEPYFNVLTGHRNSAGAFADISPMARMTRLVWARIAGIR